MSISKPPASRREAISVRIRNARYTEYEESGKVRSSSLDELETLNHYCFGGRRDMGDSFRILCLNDHSQGDETIYMAVQLMGTNSFIAHFDPSESCVRALRDRADKMKISDRIVFLTGSFRDYLKTHLQRGLPYFDYIRCCGVLDRSNNPAGDLAQILPLLRKDGALGMSLKAKYGRMPYRIMQSIRKSLCPDSPGLEEEIDRLKEYFPFMPSGNWARIAFDNLDQGTRTMKDAAFAEQFLEDDINSFSLPEIHELLDAHSLETVEFSRDFRLHYQPWFAQKDRRLIELMQQFSKRDTQAISEIICSKITDHTFWAARKTRTKADPGEPDLVPFFNPFTPAAKKRRKMFMELSENEIPELLITLAHDEVYTVPYPWNPVIRSMVPLIDGKRTIGEIAIKIREDSDEINGTKELIRMCAKFISALELEDLVLLRAPGVSPLPFTRRWLERDAERSEAT